MGNYKFNDDQLKFLENERGARWWIRKVINYFLITLVLAIVYYFVISMFVSTEQEKDLMRENELIKQEYDNLQEKVGVLDNTVKNLQMRDKDIYENIFHSNPPELSGYSKNNDYNDVKIFDTISNTSIIWNSKLNLEDLDREVTKTNGVISDINVNIKSIEGGISKVPSIIPIKDFLINQTGASIGKKVHPFYKTVVNHKGIDLLGVSGTEVVATADGVIVKSVRKAKNEGNTVEIDHGNGYVTKYMTLGDILHPKGKKVKKGEVIGRIGLSGMSFAPHLHYEVWFKGKVVDPINYFFGDITPNIYKEMLVISSNTGQSLD